MDANILLKNLQDAAATDATFLARLNTLYSKAPTVIVGLNEENLPKSLNYPMVALALASKRGGRGQDGEEFVFVAALAIIDDSDHIISGNKIYYQQIFDLEELRQLLITGLGKADMGGGYIKDVEADNDPVDLFPCFKTFMTITISRNYEVRENKLI